MYNVLRTTLLVFLLFCLCRERGPKVVTHLVSQDLQTEVSLGYDFFYLLFLSHKKAQKARGRTTGHGGWKETESYGQGFVGWIFDSAGFVGFAMKNVSFFEYETGKNQ